MLYIKYIIVIAIFFNISYGAIVNNNAFLIGKGVELGIGPDASFGSDIISPEGYYKGQYLGFISDKDLDGFSNGYNGDFFLPGSPEEGWGVSIEGVNYNNNNNIQRPQITGMVNSSGQFSDFKEEKGYYQSVKWTGKVDNLKIEKIYKIYDRGISILVDVTLTNLSTDTLHNIYYLRTIDADNNFSNLLNPTYDYKTNNIIEKQGNIDGWSLVAARSFDGSSVTLMGSTSQSRVAIGGNAIRDPLLVYHNSNKQLLDEGERMGDESISLAFKLGDIKGNESVHFNYAYNFGLNNIIFLKHKEKVVKQNHRYWVGQGAINSFSELDDTINEVKTINELIVEIKNPHKGDRLLASNLPDNITLDNKQSTDTKLVLRGRASGALYHQALLGLQFDNTLSQSELSQLSYDPRLISFYVLDEFFSPSNLMENWVYIVFPIAIDLPIMGDGKVNKKESSEFKLTGNASPFSTLNIVFSDSSGYVIEKTIELLSDGEWSLLLSEDEIKSLSEGTINISIEAIDQHKQMSKKTYSFVKDTQVEPFLIQAKNDLLTEPYINQERSASFSFSGKGEPDATITLEARDSLNKTIIVKSKVNSQGDWFLESDQLSLLEEGAVVVKIIQIDVLGNRVEKPFEWIKDSHTFITINTNLIKNNIINSSNQANIPVSGTSEKNTRIEVTFKDKNGMLVTQRTWSDDQGQWSFLPDNIVVSSLAEGDIKLMANVVDRADNQASVTYPSLLFKDTIVESNAILSPGINGVVSFERPEIKGMAEPHSTLTLSNSNGVVCTTVSDAFANWSCLLPSMNMNDNSQITVVARDAHGNSSEIPLHIIAGKYEDVQAIKTVLKGGGVFSFKFLLVFLLLLFYSNRAVYKK